MANVRLSWVDELHYNELEGVRNELCLGIADDVGIIGQVTIDARRIDRDVDRDVVLGYPALTIIRQKRKASGI